MSGVESPSVNTPRPEVLDGIYGFLESLETTPPEQIFEGYAADPPACESDPLVQPFFPPDYLPEGMYKLDANGDPLPGEYDLQEVVLASGGRFYRSGGWHIRFPSGASEEAERLTYTAGLPIYAQIQAVDPTSGQDRLAFRVPTRPLGTFFLPDRQAAPEGNPDALYFPESEFPSWKLRKLMRSEDIGSRLEEFRAPDLELLQLYGGLLAYLGNFRYNRELWEQKRTDR